MEKLNHYDVFEVIDTFNIEKVQHCDTLKNWLNISGELDDFETKLIEEARQSLELKWDEWNEEELKMLFISLVFFVAKPTEHKKINAFYERRLSGNVNDIHISLVVDCMLASPTNSGLPKMPYFFLQEFKRSLGDNHDPEGQMLAAMILTQELNQDSNPVYGCWIQGKNWNFTVLSGTEYCVSRQFDATNSEALHQITLILRKLKELIINN